MAMSAVPGVVGGAQVARATWSIVLLNTRTGEVGVASATCLTGFDLRANTPVLIAGVGGATAQSAVDQGGFNRSFIRDQFVAGTAPADILSRLATLDSGHQSRQYGMGDLRIALPGGLPGRPLTFSGGGAGAYANGQVGRVALPDGGDLVYAIQGNVLTGDPVVSRAVDAAVNTPGDVPARLMAAMEAARAQGGDGRCSCNTNSPTACGSPPAAFAKAAHIAYMLIARAGDQDASNPVYRAPTRPRGVTLADVNGDGRLDMVIATQTPRGLVAYLNDSPVGGAVPPMTNAWPVFAQPPIAVATVVAQPTVLASGDLDGDGRADMIVLSSLGGGSLTLVRTSGLGTFDPPQEIAIAGGPSSVAIGDLNGDGRPELVTANANGSNIAVLRNNGAGGGLAGRFDPPEFISVGVSGGGVAIDDLDGDGDRDVVVASSGDNSLWILWNSGNGTLGAPTQVGLGASPSRVAVGRVLSVGAPGRPDILVGVSGPSRLLVLSAGAASGVYTTTSVPLPSAPLEITLFPTPGSTLRTAVVNMPSARAAEYVTAQAGGASLSVETVTVPAQQTGIAAGDLDGDGDADLVFTQFSLDNVTVVPQAPTPGLPAPGQTALRFPGGTVAAATATGLAAGDYFMTFNVANQAATDPDPVFALRSRFDQWRLALVGKPDGVASEVSISPAQLVPGDPSRARARVTVRLRDWQGSNVDAGGIGISSVNLLHAPGSAGRSTLSTMTLNPDGTASFFASAPVARAPGSTPDRLSVQTLPAGTITETNRPVTIAPARLLGPGFAADFNQDGTVNLADVGAYLNAYFAGDPSGDYDADGVRSPADVFVFVRVYVANVSPR